MVRLSRRARSRHSTLGQLLVTQSESHQKLEGAFREVYTIDETDGASLTMSTRSGCWQGAGRLGSAPKSFTVELRSIIVTNTLEATPRKHVTVINTE
jgi:hypothetical protein